MTLLYCAFANVAMALVGGHSFWMQARRRNADSAGRHTAWQPTASDSTARMLRELPGFQEKPSTPASSRYHSHLPVLSLPCIAGPAALLSESLRRETVC